MARLGVLGWPVAHSRSPAMHNAALAHLGMHDWRYQLLPVPAALFEETVRSLAAVGFVGANVTIPHKRAALALASSASPAAEAIGAANTLTFTPDSAITAENTDAPGLLAALGRPVQGLRALVLGAGGSARAAVWALREAGAADVAVWNRTPSRAQELASELGARAVPEACSAEILVNCTPVGLAGTQGPATLERSASVHEGLNLLGLTFDQVGTYRYVVDLVYSSTPSPLLAAARAHGSHAVDGLEVLLAQGALSFEVWTGRTAPTEVMRRALRAGG